MDELPGAARFERGEQAVARAHVVVTERVGSERILPLIAAEVLAVGKVEAGILEVGPAPAAFVAGFLDEERDAAERRREQPRAPRRREGLRRRRPRRIAVEEADRPRDRALDESAEPTEERLLGHQASPR